MLLVGVFACQMYLAQGFTVSSCSNLGSNTYGPMNSVATANSKNRTAFIIPASQLSAVAGGTFTSTFFKRVTTTGALNADTTFKIYLKNVTATDFGSTSPTWSTEIGSATLVYDSNPQAAVGSAEGWKEFAHSTNFVYTSGSNLAVYLEYVQTTAQAASISWNYEYTSPCVNTSNSNTTKYSNTTSAFGATLGSSDYRRPLIGFNVTMPPATVVPACSTLTAPANAATGVSITPTLTWGAVSNAHTYNVNLGTTSGGINVLNAYNAGLNTSYAFSSSNQLNYATTYYATVIPSNNIGSATGCIESSFTTIAVPCPSVSQPATAAVGTSLKPTITWSSVAGVTGYKLSVGTTAGGTDILNNIDLGNVLTYTFASNLNPSTQYFYTVKSYQGANVSSGCTERNFTTGTAVPPANDECVNAVVLTVNPSLTCTATTSGNTLGSSMSMAATSCLVTPNDDVWFTFVATSPSHIVTLSNIVSTGTTTGITDMYFQVLSGSCGNMTSMLCSDLESNTVTGLTVGQTYYIRVYTYSAAATASASFNICVSTPPAPPVNDECANAISLNVNPDMNCGAVTSGTTLGGTSSGVALGSCSGTADDDVWYKFTATSTAHTIQLKNVVSVGTSSSSSLYSQVFSGVCGTLTSLNCISSNTNFSYLTGLTVGQTYYVRVYTYEVNSGATFYAHNFDVCVGTLPAAPANDDCSSATSLVVNSTLTCSAPVAGTTLSATNSNVAVGTCTGTPDDDVWYSFTAIGTAHTVVLSNVLSVGNSSSTSLYTQVFSGACGSLTSIKCGTTTTTNLTGLTPGQVYYVRVYNSNTNTTSIYANTFNICIGTPPPPPTNDDCANATSLTVSTNDTSTFVTGSTVSATQSTGTTPGCSASGINDDVWYSFTASATTHFVQVLYSDNATTTQIYSGACGSLTAVSCFDGGLGNSSMLLQNLTIGQTYYVRVYSSTSTSTTTSSFQIAVTTPTVPSNDTCATATAISCGGTVQGNNALATDDALPTSTCGSSGTTASYKGVWFTVSATENGPIVVDACGTQYDAYLRVYTGSCSALTCFSNTVGVGYADSGCTSNLYNSPTVTFTGVAGTTYYILLTGYTAARIGNYSVSITQGCTNLATLESVKKEEVKAYPNPFTDLLTISDVKDVKSIMISDMSGKIVKTIQKPESTLRLGDLNAGMYLVILNMNDGSRQTVKAIKR